MNYQKIVHYLKKYKFILVFAVLVGLAAGIFFWLKGERYDVSLALTISRQGTQAVFDYKYDNYYALMASDEFGDTVTGWFKTPEVGRLIYQKAGFNSSFPSLKELAGRFSAAKIAPNIVEVRYGTKSEAETKALASAIGTVISERTNSLNTISGQGISFAVLAGEPVAAKSDYKFWWNILIGFLAGLVVGFFTKTAKEYFR
jgi:capsular polysaccharide biosynthesis protein